MRLLMVAILVIDRRHLVVRKQCTVRQVPIQLASAGVCLLDFLEWSALFLPRLHSANKKYFQVPFWFSIVSETRELLTVPGRTPK